MKTLKYKFFNGFFASDENYFQTHIRGFHTTMTIKWLYSIHTTSSQTWKMVLTNEYVSITPNTQNLKFLRNFDLEIYEPKIQNFSFLSC